MITNYDIIALPVATLNKNSFANEVMSHVYREKIPSIGYYKGTVLYCALQGIATSSVWIILTTIIHYYKISRPCHHQV